MPSPSEGLSASGLRAGYGARAVIAGLDLTIPGSAFTALVGPNGSGKSTLLRCLAGLLKPSGGNVLLGGRTVASFPRKALARRVSFLPQAPVAPDGLTVADLVRQGRYPHRGLFSRWGETDEEACAAALALTSLEALRDRALNTLSGGQRQRAWIAMSLAQRTRIMLLDEPTTFLDIAHQLEVLALLRDLARDHGVTVVAVLHDLNQAARHADHIVMMLDGGIAAAGSPAGIVRPETIDRVFGVRSRIITDPEDGTNLIVPLLKSG